MNKMAKGLVKKFVGRKSMQGLWEFIYKCSLLGMNIGGGSSFSESGEKKAIKYIVDKVYSGKKELIVFDVGANVGGVL